MQNRIKRSVLTVVFSLVLSGALMLLDVTEVQAQCNECMTCWTSGQQGHWLVTGIPMYIGLHPDACNGGSCAVAHSWCGAPEDDDEDVDVEDVAAAFSAAEGADEFADLMDRFRGFVSYNAKRRSIQVVGCDLATVVANIPLTEAQIDALSAD